MNDFMSHCKLSYKPIKSSEREELQDDLMVGNKRGISGHNVDNFYKVLLVMFVFFIFFRWQPSCTHLFILLAHQSLLLIDIVKCLCIEIMERYQ